MFLLKNIKSLLLTAMILCLAVSGGYSHGGEKHGEKTERAKDTVSAVASTVDTAAHKYGEQVTVPSDPVPVAEFPNLHPLVVHFPIVLLIAAALMQVAGLFFTSRPYAITVAVIASLGFIGAYLASNNFHGHAAELTGVAGALFEEHEFWAFWSVRLVGIAALIQIVSLFFKPVLITKGIVAVFLLGAAVCVSISGHHGAELVHKYGIGPKGNLLEQHH